MKIKSMFKKASVIILTCLWAWLFCGRATAVHAGLIYECDGQYVTIIGAGVQTADLLERLSIDGRLHLFVEEAALTQSVTTNIKKAKISEALRAILKFYSYAVIYQKDATEVGVSPLGRETLTISLRHPAPTGRLSGTDLGQGLTANGNDSLSRSGGRPGKADVTAALGNGYEKHLSQHDRPARAQTVLMRGQASETAEPNTALTSQEDGAAQNPAAEGQLSPEVEAMMPQAALDQITDPSKKEKWLQTQIAELESRINSGYADDWYDTWKPIKGQAIVHDSVYLAWYQKQLNELY